MVSKRRVDHVFQIADIPKGPRSIRRRGQYKKSIVDDDNICAFELLASLAGKLLQESESSTSSNASEKHDQLVKDDKTIKAESDGLGTYERSAVSEAASQNDDAVLERTSTISVVNCPGDLKSENSLKDNVSGDFPDSDVHSENDFGQHQEEVHGLVEQCSRKDPLELTLKFPALINSNSNVKSPSIRAPVHNNASFARRKNDIKLGSRDDDEKIFRYSKLNNKFKAYRFTRIGDRRIRKLLTSKYWKVAPTLKDYEFSKADGGRKPLYRKRKTCYGHERYQRESLYKRKKFSDQNSDGAFSSESVSNSPLKGSTGGKCAELNKAKNNGHEASFHPKDSHVKFSIKSFRVPELFVEVPETATVGSLKRTVMEAVTAMLVGGIRVGVVLQGKKVRDDNRTLSQTGISCKDDLNTLGFTLEPSVVQPPTPLPASSEDPPLSLPCEKTPQQERSSVATVLESGIPDVLPDPSSLTDSSNHVDSAPDSVSHQTDSLTDQNLPDSRALVTVPVPVHAPAIKVEPLAVVPVNQKASRRSELAQRRTRRPFSVNEVEALVRAVEELGTGRWRDVKLRSFENADHRTYVDLKDKWKTLVHTAKIAPQQRRGEPVPQDLLDRVLAAHAYWCTHQAKQQGKHQSVLVPLMIADALTDNDVEPSN